MSIFQCDKCGCLENSAMSSTYHVRNLPDLMPKELLGMALCCVCSPEEYVGGSKNIRAGKWHGRFERIFFPKGTIYTDQEGNVRLKDSASVPDYSKASDKEIK